jgi:hypothetical protein
VTATVGVPLPERCFEPVAHEGGVVGDDDGQATRRQRNHVFSIGRRVRTIGFIADIVAPI